MNEELNTKQKDFPDFIEVPPLKHPEAHGFAIKKAYLEVGAERYAHFATEINSKNYSVGESLICK